MSRHSDGGGRAGGARQWLNDHSGVVTIVAMVVLIGAVLFMIKWDDGPEPPTPGQQKGYFYDTVTEKIFVDTRDNIPPLLNEAGHECVRAVMFTCGSCAESERWPGFYEKHTDEYKQQLEEIRKKTDGPYIPMGSMEPGQPGMLISIDGQTWVTPMDPSVRDRYKEMAAKCSDGKYRPCNPGDEDKGK